MKISHIFATFLILVGTTLVAPQAMGHDMTSGNRVNSNNPATKMTNTNAGNVAVQGYDVVSYFKDNKAVRGNRKIIGQHDGVNYFFATKANKAQFMKDPHKYMPQYGGFCAYAMAAGKRVDIDPQAFSMRNGKLYLNYSKSVQQDWQQKAGQYVKQADAEWKKMQQNAKKGAAY